MFLWFSDDFLGRRRRRRRRIDSSVFRLELTTIKQSSKRLLDPPVDGPRLMPFAAIRAKLDL